MTRRTRVPLAERVARAAEQALAVDGTVSLLDVLTGMRWLDPGAMKRWQQGQIATLEETLQVNADRLAEAIMLFHAWAAEYGLLAQEVPHVARSPQRPPLRFTRAGDPAVETLFRTHYVSPALPEKQRERVVERASRPPELVVILPRNRDWTCHRCGETGDMLIMEQPGPSCLRCAGLDGLEFLGAGDALLTRRAKAHSARCAVVVRFSRTRKQYERQGVLVEPAALRQAEQEVAAKQHATAG